MQTSVRQTAAKAFAERWAGKGYEKGESQAFWIDLLQSVFGIGSPVGFISFENQVKLSSTSFIDAYIEPTHVLIEQKSIDKDLRKAHQENDRAVMEAYGFAWRTMTESDCVASLFRMYSNLIKINRMKNNNAFYQEALDFIGKTDLASLPNGKHVIDEGNVWVNIVETSLRPIADALLEAHDEFIDIQIPLSADESYGTRPRSECVKPRGEIDRENDIIFFDDPAAEIVTKKAGEMIVFAPDTAHAPLIGEGVIRKAIFKIRAVAP